MTNLPSTHVSLVVEPKLSQGVVTGKRLNQRHHTLPRHIVGLYIQTNDGRVVLERLSDGQGHGVIGVSVRQAEDSHVRVGPQGLCKPDERVLRRQPGNEVASE